MLKTALLHRRTRSSLAIVGLAATLVALPVGCSSSSTGTASECAVCNIKTFDCSIDAPPLTGQATIDTVGDTTCSGIIGAGDEMPRFWIDCETSTICVEHTDECFDATFSAQGFSYTIPGKSSTITCTAK